MLLQAVTPNAQKMQTLNGVLKEAQMEAAVSVVGAEAAFVGLAFDETLVALVAAAVAAVSQVGIIAAAGLANNHAVEQASCAPQNCFLADNYLSYTSKLQLGGLCYCAAVAAATFEHANYLCILSVIVPLNGA